MIAHRLWHLALTGSLTLAFGVNRAAILIPGANARTDRQRIAVPSYVPRRPAR